MQTSPIHRGGSARRQPGSPFFTGFYYSCVAYAAPTAIRGRGLLEKTEWTFPQKGTTVAVVDGEKLNFFRNSGDAARHASPDADELRKHYHQKLSAVLVGEIAKDLTGHSIQNIEKLVAAA